MLTDSLPDGLTTRDRSFVYLECGSCGCPEDGTLALTETTGKRKPVQVVRKYAVEEQPAAGFPGRVFLLAKLVHKGDTHTAAGRAGEGRTGEIYECSVTKEAAGCRCTCTAGATAKGRPPGARVQSVPCVHLEALTSLLALGLDDPRESGSDRVPQSRERVTTFENDEM